MNSVKSKQITQEIKRLVQKDPRFNLNELRVIIALERAIARIELNKELAKHLIFKGGFVLLKIFDSQRFTRDADALAESITQKKLKDLVCQALSMNLDDGLWFGDIKIENVQEQGQYKAIRFDFAFQIGSPDLKKVYKLSRIHIDVSFSDSIPGKLAKQIMPSIISFEMPVSWKVYPVEYIVAEKLEAFYSRGSANSRAKDIYDLVYLIPYCTKVNKVIEAIVQTFKNRKTPIPVSFVREAQKFDSSILQAAWNGVRVLEKGVEFKTTWRQLIQFLKKLDVYLSANIKD